MEEQGSEHVEELGLDPVAVVRKPQPRALWAVLAVVAVVAGALVVVTSSGDDANQRLALPVDLAGTSGAGRAEAAADAAMIAWVTYIPGDDLPALGGEATAYRLHGDVDEGQVRELADALGLSGGIQSDGPGSWWVAGEAGLGRLDVYAGGGAHWSYSAGSQDCAGADGLGSCAAGGSNSSAGSNGSGTARACDGGMPACTVTTAIEPDACVEAADDVAVDCAVAPITTYTLPPPCPPGTDCVTLEACREAGGTASTCSDDTATDAATARPLLVGEDEARAAALEVVAASGADVEGARVTAESGSESRTWLVTVEPVVDGIPTGLVSYVEVSEDAVVASGNGYFGEPEALGEYPVLDTRAVIDRANTQSRVGVEPSLGAADDTASGTNGGGEDGTDVGGTTGGDGPTTTLVTASDPCAVPEGASDGCSGTTGCGGDGCADVVEPTATTPCKVQPDGREICEYDTVEPEPEPEPQPVEVVLVDAEPSLVPLPATDGGADAYLVPAYRFTVEDGSTVDLPAVADEAVAGPGTTETTVPDTVEPSPVPVPEPQRCEVLEEDNSSGTTHTIQTCPTPKEDPGVLKGGEEPAVGVGYYVDVDTLCGGGSFELGGQIWVAGDDAVAGWADPGEQHEGGTFTLDAEDHGTFVGDAAATKVADFRTLGPAEDIFCTPEPRG